MSQNASALLWAMPQESAAQETVESAARDCGLGTRFCKHKELMDGVRQEPNVIVGIELPKETAPTLALARELHDEFPGIAIIMASEDTGVSIIRPAIEAGASDIIGLPIQSSELQKALIKALARGPVAAPGEAGSPGQLVTVFGARGGLGATTLAVNLAVQFNKLALGNVALVDLDLQRGDCAAFLNLTPSQSISTMAAAGSHIDELLLFSTLIRHGSGISLLAAPQHIEEADVVGPEETELALSLLRQRFRFTVVDTSRALTALSVALLSHTDRALVLTDLSVPSVRSAHRILDLLRSLKMTRDGLDLVIVEGENDIVPLADAVRAIGKDPLIKIPRDVAAASHAMNAGTPLNGPRPSSLLVAISELAAKLAGVQNAPTAKRSRLQQLFSRGS